MGFFSHFFLDPGEEMLCFLPFGGPERGSSVCSLQAFVIHIHFTIFSLIMSYLI